MQFNKENNLSFHNITNALKQKKHLSSSTCHLHPQRASNYKNKITYVTYCTPCAIQEASRGTLVEEINKKTEKDNFNDLLHKQFKKAQATISKSIEIYNTKFNRLKEMLMDMQIKDIMNFNRQMEQNQEIYDSFQRPNIQTHLVQVKLAFSQQNKTSQVLQKVDRLIENIQISIKGKYRQSYPAVSNLNCSPTDYEFKNHNTIANSQISNSQSSSQHSYNRSPQINSLKSKSSTVSQLKKIQYEDTPESVKSKISASNIKVTSDMAVTMFQKINVCQSINMAGSDSEYDLKTRSIDKDIVEEGSLKPSRSRYRYQTNNNMQTDR